VFVGATGLGVVVVVEGAETAGRDWIMDVGAEVATVEPFLFVAMTVTRNVFPTSAAATM
jgi:hypothetical protein